MSKEIVCKCGCGMTRMVKESDLKRGWGKYFSKSCKARDQERRTGQNRRRKLMEQNDFDPCYHPFSQEALGQWED